MTILKTLAAGARASSERPRRPGLALRVLGHGQHPAGGGLEQHGGGPGHPVVGEHLLDALLQARDGGQHRAPGAERRDVAVGDPVEGGLGEAELGGAATGGITGATRGGADGHGRGLGLVPAGEDERPARGVDARGGSRPGKREEDEEGPEGGEQPGGEAGPCHRDIGIVVEGWHTVKKEAERPGADRSASRAACGRAAPRRLPGDARGVRAAVLGGLPRSAAFFLGAAFLGAAFLAAFLPAGFVARASARLRFSTAWAAARRAMGRRYGEQET